MGLYMCMRACSQLHMYKLRRIARQRDMSMKRSEIRMHRIDNFKFMGSDPLTKFLRLLCGRRRNHRRNILKMRERSKRKMQISMKRCAMRVLTMTPLAFMRKPDVKPYQTTTAE